MFEMFRSKQTEMVLVMKIFDKLELSKSQQVLLLTEASIMRQLHHTNLISIISEQETEARLCQVLELSLVGVFSRMSSFAVSGRRAFDGLSATAEPCASPRVVRWWQNVGLVIERSRVRVSATALSSTAMSKPLTHTCLCHREV